ncbi:MAG TPA: FGGY-family carbohydrate kinase [Acidimicrobiales bacterium]|nr:FGGY-family carbohydrate kinase [Acidimicrobiales bacterium]
MILTFDLGTSVTKAAVWGPDGPVAEGRATLATDHPQPGWVEQDPEAWWTSLADAAAAARAADPGAWRQVEAVVFAAARETFALFDEQGRAVSAGIVWSDRRGQIEHADRHVAPGQAGTGTTHGNLLWLASHRPDQFAAARWALAPRDLIVWRLTGEVATDRTLASRTGLYRRDGALLDSALTQLLAPVQASTHVVGALRASVAEQLGLAPSVVVVLGAGDRACEVLGAGANATEPMVSWGTTANVSIPLSAVPDGVDPRIAVSAGALGGSLLECGLSSAGAAIEWLGRLTGSATSDLYAAAAGAPAGANGALATTWLNGARAPWWSPNASAALAGLSGATGPGDLARAIVESVAFDAHRCLDLLGLAQLPPVVLHAAGGGGAGRPWPDVLAAVTESPVEVRRSDLAASAGALLIAAAALGRTINLDDVNPVAGRIAPDPKLVATYRRLRPAADRLSAAALSLDR